MLVLLLGINLMPTHAQETPLLSGRIVYEAKINSEFSRIYGVSITGGDPVDLSKPGTNQTDRSPAVSPDGTRIAFVRNSTEILTMSADGSNITTLYTAPSGIFIVVDAGLSFSPDSKQIAFVAHQERPSPSRHDIYLVSIETGQARPLTSQLNTSDESRIDFYFARFSPANNNQIVFQSNLEFGCFCMYTLNVSDSSHRKIADAVLQRPGFSPDGSRMAYFSGITPDNATRYNLNIIDPNAADSQPLQLATDLVSADSPPVFSGDSSKVIFSNGGLYSVAISGGAAAQITNPGQLVVDSYPMFSPDGTNLVFVRTTTRQVPPSEGGSPLEESDEILTVNSDGTNERKWALPQDKYGIVTFPFVIAWDTSVTTGTSVTSATNVTNVSSIEELSDAIVAANATSTTADTIVLTGNLTATAVNNTVLGPNAFPVITSPITISGAGFKINRAPDAPAFRFFRVEGTSGNLTLLDITLEGGDAGEGLDAGAVFVDARNGGRTSLTTSNANFLSNRANGNGGAILAITDNSGTVTTDLRGGVFDGNAGGVGAAFYNGGFGGLAQASVTNVIITNSSGIAIYNNGQGVGGNAQITLTEVSFTNIVPPVIVLNDGKLGGSAILNLMASPSGGFGVTLEATHVIINDGSSGGSATTNWSGQPFVVSNAAVCITGSTTLETSACP